jgi:hypothetical protein
MNLLLNALLLLQILNLEERGNKIFFVKSIKMLANKPSTSFCIFAYSTRMEEASEVFSEMWVLSSDI